MLHDQTGKELYDVPRAPRPPASTPAPPRFLPDYDNVLLSHADRRHIITDEHRKALQSVNGVLPGTVLVDGYVAAQWAIERRRESARLMITALEPIPAAAREAVTEEGRGLLTLLAASSVSHVVELH